MTGVVTVRVASAADLQEVPGVEAAADELFRAGGVLDLPPAASAAERAGARRVTLLTYADVPWNAPWYARHGWRVTDDLGPSCARSPTTRCSWA
jgi:hypothetical protein